MSRARFGGLVLVAIVVAAAAMLWARDEVPGVPPERLATAPVLAVGGDVNLARRQHIHTRREGAAAALSRVPQLGDADLAMANLECVMSTTGQPGVDKGDGGFFYFRGRPEMLSILGHAGIDVVGTANNHIGDYGPDAIREQASWLDSMNLAHVGSGADRESACAPIIRHAQDLAVAFLMVDATQPLYAATAKRPGACFLPLEDPETWRDELAPRIAAARESADLVMVAVHWGKNNAEQPTPAEIDIGRAIVDAGADAVLGSSAHVLQGIEVHDGRPILHDTGNLLFDFTKKTVRDSAVFGLYLGPEGVLGIRVTPILSRAGHTHVATGDDARRILSKLRAQSETFGTKLRIDGEQGIVALPLPPPRPAPPSPAAQDPAPAPAPAPLSEPPPQCVASQVPASAAIEPVHVGPLTLVGIQIDKTVLLRPETVGLTTYWSVEEAPAEDLVLFERFVPAGPKKDGAWGHDHDPCDWQWPTSRWNPGTIYRDEVQVRPPGHFRPGDYELKVGLWRAGKRLGPRPIVGRLTIDPEN